MINGFPEFAVGGVLLAPFVPQAVIAVAIFFALRPLLRRLPLEAIFVNASLVAVCLYVVILAMVMLLY